MLTSLSSNASLQPPAHAAQPGSAISNLQSPTPDPPRSVPLLLTVTPHSNSPL
ncbi:MAG: hypothetical protein HY784_01325 [Chloroflexi bacterium]|nr:hypothetical protein [Chloroflexota bacterium]